MVVYAQYMEVMYLNGAKTAARVRQVPRLIDLLLWLQPDANT